MTAEIRASERHRELEKMMHVCDCFKMWQQPSAQEEEDGDDDDG